MPRAMVSEQPLPFNFPQDFLPDRTLLSRLLGFASREGTGDKQAISDDTGIPTGKSTGKVEPMIRYALGMGLVLAQRSAGIWTLRLSGAGRRVFQEDPYLEEAPTLWFCHLMLCRRTGPATPATGLADAWFTLFAEGANRLGNPFSRSAFLGALEERHGSKSYLRKLSGVVPRTYVEPSCLGGLGLLQHLDDPAEERFERFSAPDERVIYPACACALLLAWDALFPERRQIPLDELLGQSRLLAVLSWQGAEAEHWVHWLCERGLIRLDRLTGTTMALRLSDSSVAVQGLYRELV